MNFSLTEMLTIIWHKLAEIIIKNSTECNIDLNAKRNDGMTAFHNACLKGHSDGVLKMACRTLQIQYTNSVQMQYK